jgi:hypothetical protein
MHAVKDYIDVSRAHEKRTTEDAAKDKVSPGPMRRGPPQRMQLWTR